MKEFTLQATGYRFTEESEGVEIGHAYLYVLQNDLHTAPFGLLEDLYVEPLFRAQGIGGLLHERVVTKARETGCYKLIATSRDDGSREKVRAWYARLGYRTYGTEFRIDL